MLPPFTITSKVLERIAAIERLLGRMESLEHPKPQPYLRKSNRVRTVQGSLAIEGNTLRTDQVTALLDGKQVIGSQSDIQEVLNAIRVYEEIHAYKPNSSRSLLKAHRIMMAGLLPSAGNWRTSNVGVFKGSRVSHIAPPADRVSYLMEELFGFLKKDKSHALIKSSVFHYELEFIHPFEDGNGRIGRFWHSLLLTHYHPVFEFTPVESIIKDNQQDYYAVLGQSDKAGDSTAFLEFSLEMVYRALDDLVEAIRPEPANPETRLERACGQFGSTYFSRKDYLALYKSISSATASRDLKSGVDSGLLKKQGDKAQTVYQFLS